MLVNQAQQLYRRPLPAIDEFVMDCFAICTGYLNVARCDRRRGGAKLARLNGTDMATTTITFEIDDKLKQQFAQIARERHCSIEELLPGLVREFVDSDSDTEYNAWFREQVQIGIDEIASGQFVSGEEVEAEFATRRAETERRLRGKPE